jgi:hypothetical protein
MYTKLTLTDCFQSLSDRLTNGVVPADSATLTLWTRLLNRGVLFCADKLRINKQTTLTTVGGTIALPADFILINDVFDSGNSAQKQVDPGDLANHTGPVYWISGDQFNGFYLNTPADSTWTVEYAYRPTPMVTGTDVCIVPDIEIPVSFAYSLKRKASSDPFEDADSAMQECLARIKELQSATSINNDSISFSWE